MRAPLSVIWMASILAGASFIFLSEKPFEHNFLNVFDSLNRSDTLHHIISHYIALLYIILHYNTSSVVFVGGTGGLSPQWSRENQFFLTFSSFFRQFFLNFYIDPHCFSLQIPPWTNHIPPYHVTLRYIAEYSITLHCTTLHCISLYCTTLHCIILILILITLQ